MKSKKCCCIDFSKDYTDYETPWDKQFEKELFLTFFFEKANSMKEIRNLVVDPYLFIADPPLPEATWVQHQMVCNFISCTWQPCLIKYAYPFLFAKIKIYACILGRTNWLKELHITWTTSLLKNRTLSDRLQTKGPH